MKKFMITAMGAALLVGGGFYASQEGHAEASVAKVKSVQYVHSNKVVNTASVEINKLPEYATLSAQVDLSSYSLRVVEDNANKRVIVLKDSNGHDAMKSLFMKKENRLKVINYRGGMIFNGAIGVEAEKKAETTTPEKKAPSVSTSTESQSKEYKTLSAQVNLAGFTTKVVENNRNKRITLFMNSNGVTQYKTIYIKKTGMVKVINL